MALDVAGHHDFVVSLPGGRDADGRKAYPDRMGKVILGVIAGFILFPILLIWLLTSIF